jgi:predicted enzyme related to lactoylglutathione lyase
LHPLGPWRPRSSDWSGLGARRLRLVEEVDDFGLFTVVQDPEGNEFCVEA